MNTTELYDLNNHSTEELQQLFRTTTDLTICDDKVGWCEYELNGDKKFFYINGIYDDSHAEITLENGEQISVPNIKKNLL